MLVTWKELKVPSFPRPKLGRVHAQKSVSLNENERKATICAHHKHHLHPSIVYCLLIL